MVSTPRMQKMSLIPDGRAGQRPRIAPRLAGGVDGVGPTARAGVVDLQVASQRSVQRGDARSRNCSVTSRALNVPARTPSTIDTRLAPRGVDHDSSSTAGGPAGPGTMRGTWKKLASRRGAFASASSIGSEGAV